MSDLSVPLAALAQFHREVIVPDIERIVGGSERRLRDDMHSQHDFTLAALQRLDFESQAMKPGLTRIEAGVQGVEERLTTVEQRLTTVEQRLTTVEQRLDTVEQHLDVQRPSEP